MDNVAIKKSTFFDTYISVGIRKDMVLVKHTNALQ